MAIVRSRQVCACGFYRLPTRTKPLASRDGIDAHTRHRKQGHTYLVGGMIFKIARSFSKTRQGPECAHTPATRDLSSRLRSRSAPGTEPQPEGAGEGRFPVIPGPGFKKLRRKAWSYGPLDTEFVLRKFTASGNFWSAALRNQ